MVRHAPDPTTTAHCDGCGLPDWATDRARRGLPPVVTHWAPDDPRYAHLEPSAGR